MLAYAPPQPLAPALTHLDIKADGLPHRIALSDVQYIEGFGNYVKLHTTRRVWVVLETMQHWEQTLPGPPFCRIHKSFLVNLAMVARLTSEGIQLRNGHTLPLGRRDAALFELRWNAFVRVV